MSETTVTQKPIELQRGEQSAQVALTLRDYFAAQAMKVLCEGIYEPSSIAQDAYELADAMLKERAK